MTETYEFEGRIEKAIKDSERNYADTIKKIRELKDRISELEITISKKGNDESSEEMRELNSLEEKLNASIDSLILGSKAEWEDFRRLEQESKARRFDYVRLESFKAICIKTEELAKNLLCYSLGRFRRKDQ